MSFPLLALRSLIRIVLLLMLVALISSASLPRSVQAANDFSTTDTVIQQLMTTYNVPGAALAIIQDGKISYMKGYGYRDVEKKLPVTTATVFAIGSVSKSFTSLAVMQLVEQGKIDLDALVTQYVPEFEIAVPEYTKLLKVRHLISHSSGIPRADDQWFGRIPANREEVIKAMAEIQPIGKPGEVYGYSNQNYVLAGYIIEKVTGQSWETYIQEHIFKPLGMKSASFGMDELLNSAEFALPYVWDIAKGVAVPPLDSMENKTIKVIGPAGSINANLTDMAAYALMQLGYSTQVVSKPSLDLIHTGQTTLDKPSSEKLAQLQVSDAKYAFGWIDELYRGKRIIWHNGSYTGVLASVTLLPEQNAAVVLLTNTSSTQAFMESARLLLAENLLGLTPTINLASTIEEVYHPDLQLYKQEVAAARAYQSAPGELEVYVGNYIGDIGSFKISLKASTLYVSIESPVKQDIALYAITKGEFLLNTDTGDATTFTIQTDSTGVMTIYQGGTKVAQRSN